MKRFHLALTDRSAPSPDEIENDEQELRDILKESDEKAKKLFEKQPPDRCDSAENSLRIALKKRQARY